MSVVVVAGARPQFVKAAALLPALRARTTALLVHTGQHGDPRMVEAHFEGLGLAPPDERLELRERERAPRLAEMSAGLAALFARLHPSRVLALGDTDTTVAAAEAAAALRIPVGHVEAGARSGEPDLPEERNRIRVDALSDLLFCSTPAHAAHLGGRRGVHVVGDLMADALLAREAIVRARTADRPRTPYGILTVHRAATADDPRALARVLAGVATSPCPVLFPLHPRTRPTDLPPAVSPRPPLPYLEFLALVAGAAFVATDSGGVQKEAYLLGVPCITLREATEWGETVAEGWNVLVGTDTARIGRAIARPPRAATRPPLYGDGRAGPRIAALLERPAGKEQRAAARAEDDRDEEGPLAVARQRERAEHEDGADRAGQLG